MIETHIQSAATAAVPLQAGFFENVAQSILTGAMQGGVYALMSLGLTIIFGVMGIINFAQADFMMMGMYASFVVVVSFGISPLIGFFLLFPLFFGIGIAVYRSTIEPILDAPEDAQLITTFGLLLILQHTALAIFGPNVKSPGLSYATQSFTLGAFKVNQAKAIAFVFALGVALTTYLLLQRTEFGRALRATANNKVAAGYAGIDIQRMYTAAFGLGIALTASAGVLIVMYRSASPTVGFDFIILMFVVVILGGLGSIKGALIAGLLLGIIEQVAVIWVPLELQPALAFVLFLAVILVRPQGLYGSKGRAV